MQIFMKNRFSLVILLMAIFILLSFASRVALLVTDYAQIEVGVVAFTKLFLVGLFYDIVASLYFVIPFVLYLIVIPNRIFMTKIHQYAIALFFFAEIYLLAFNGFSEWFFWEEFGKRFNFIAVDYLVYTHEVIHNILESYPIPLLLSIIFLLSLVIFYLMYAKTTLFKKPFGSTMGFLPRLKTGTVFLSLPILFFVILDKQSLSTVSENQYNNELAKNGLYSLFSAFINNTLDYEEFYKSEDKDVMMKNLNRLAGFDDTHNKQIKKEGEEKKHNIMLIMVESLSAEYMGLYGNPKGLTPHLDALAKKSLFFDNFYATGTRTVRGMEAVALSIPPTPGRSIVKRPDNHGMFSSGFVFRDHGYDTKFIYAGYGYFDNMNDFFSHNGFDIIDRTNMSEEEIHFANVWGVSDEDLLDKTLGEADKSYKAGKPFYNFIMTTSNHRPFTYPDGKIDIPSHTGRDGGVKYTDFAIGEFIRNASKKPWFKDTLFVIVADHNGGSSGQSELPVWRYKIPLIIYAPEHITPKVISTLSSQIDIMPTLLSMMNWSYESKFYGDDILSATFAPRAFVGNYQKLGYLTKEKLLILSPDKSVKQYDILTQTTTDTTYKETTPTPQDTLDAITYYQSASYLYKHGLNRWEK